MPLVVFEIQFDWGRGGGGGPLSVGGMGVEDAWCDPREIRETVGSRPGNSLTKDHTTDSRTYTRKQHLQSSLHKEKLQPLCTFIAYVSLQS